MTRRDLLLTAFAQRVHYRDYSRCLPDHLRALAHAAYIKRTAALNKLTTPQAIAARQQWVRQTFWQLVGGEPARTPLNARTTASREHNNLRIENVVFESQPQTDVTANLYVPTAGKPPYPGVLFQPGHATNGKAYDLYQTCCQAMAQLGCVVLSIDPMGQGERRRFPKIDSADDEHTIVGKQLLLVGNTATRLQTWDALRAIDYLASLPYVDAKRIVTTGQSGGGTNSMFLAAADHRIAGAAIACPNSENVAVQNFITPGATDDAEQNLLNSGPHGFDRWDLLYPLAPKPLLIAVSAKDAGGTYSPNYIVNGREEFARLQRTYALLQAPAHIAWYETPLPHGLHLDLRLQIYNWINRWLLHRPAITEEPPTKPLPEDALRAVDKARLHPISPAALKIPLEPRKPIGRLTRLGATPHIEAIEVQSAPSVFLPAWLLKPKTGASKATLLVLDSQGRRQFREGELLHELASAGYTICAADLRGFGDLTPPISPGPPRYAQNHSTEQHYAWASLILGEPLLAQRITDILSLVKALPGPIAIWARGLTVQPALHAAQRDKRIRAVLQSPFTEPAPLGYFIPPHRQYLDPFGSYVPGHSQAPSHSDTTTIHEFLRQL